MRKTLQLMMVIGLAAAGGSGCATTRAATPAERPALDVPLPPPRVIMPTPAVPEPPAPEPVAEIPGSGTPAPARPRPPRDTTKPEAKPEETKPVEPPPPAAQTPPVPQLRIPETGDGAQAAVQIRSMVERTRAALGKIDYGPLSEARKKVYDDAKLFNGQAEEALKSDNLVAAKELAEKAERLTKELQGRY